VLDAAEVVEQAGSVGAGAETGGAQDAERAPIERRRLGVTALVLAEHPEIVERAGEIQIARPELPLGERDGAAAVTVGGRVMPERAVCAAESARRLDAESLHVGVAEARVAIEQRVRARVAARRLLPAIARLQRGAEIQQRRRDVGVRASLLALEDGDRSAREALCLRVATFVASHRRGNQQRGRVRIVRGHPGVACFRDRRGATLGASQFVQHTRTRRAR